MTNTLEIITDVGRTFTAKASANVSGGYLLKWTSGTDVGSQASQYAWDDISVAQTDSQTNVVGVCLTDATSGNAVTVATQGIFILPAGSVTVSGGEPVISSGYGNMVEYYDQTKAGSIVPVGRALSTATALTGHAIVKVNI